MTVQLTLRATDGQFKWAFEEWSALVAIASVSAEPESSSEFFAGLRRYQPGHNWEAAAERSEFLHDAESRDGRWCLIDLTSQSVIVGSEFELPDHRSALQADGDEHGEGSRVIWLDTPPDWLLETASDDWNGIVTARTADRAGRDRVDARAVIYGRPMLQFMADRVLVSAACGIPEDQREERSRGIHADWLMTSRGDLNCATPREVLLKNHEHIGWDLQHRSEQWSMQGFAVPPLDVDSTAYRFAAPGTIEIVTYFNLLRSLLGAAWEHVDAGEKDAERLTAKLMGQRDDFLDSPPADGGGVLSCRELIESERRRMPITGDMSHLDCDCPICQASADGDFGTGPMFMFYDSHHLELEDEFAFSMIESRDVWEQRQAEDRRMMEEFNQKQADQKSSSNEPASVWRSSFVDWDNVHGASGVSPRMALGFPLAELITRLQELGADQTHIDSLNQSFTTFRSADDQFAVESAAGGLATCLENAACEFPELVSQSADLQSRLDEVLRTLNDRATELAAELQRANDPEPALASTPPILNVVVFRSPGPTDDEIDGASAEHTRTISTRPLGGGLGYLTLEPADFDRVSDGISAGDSEGTATAILHFMGPKAKDLIQQPQDLDYCWNVTDNTNYDKVLLLQVVMRPHLLE